MSRSGSSPMQPPGLRHSCHVQIPKMLLVSLPPSSEVARVYLPTQHIVNVVRVRSILLYPVWQRCFSTQESFSSHDHGAQISGAEQGKSESELQSRPDPPGGLVQATGGSDLLYYQPHL